jgi:hypothetical protein
MSSKNQYEREIEELLESLDVKMEPPSREPIRFRPRRPSPLQRAGAALGRLRPASPKQLMIVSAVIFCGAFFAFQFLAIAPSVTRPIAAFGVVLLLFAYFTHFIRPTVVARRWRGRMIEIPNERPGWAQKLYRIIYRD